MQVLTYEYRSHKNVGSGTFSEILNIKLYD